MSAVLTGLIRILEAAALLALAFAATRICFLVFAGTGRRGIRVNRRLDIGGAPQWVSVRGRDKGNPLLLVLHGGPGSALTQYCHLYQRRWEKRWTVVNWDQRLAGKTLLESDPALAAEAFSLERTVLDSLEVLKFARELTGQERAAVLGQSWGTMVGAKLALEHPEAVSCYIGTGQVADAEREPLLALGFLRERAERAGDKKSVARIDAIRVRYERGELGYYAPDFEAVFWPLMRRFGGTSVRLNNRFSAWLFDFFATLTSPELTLKQAVSLIGNTAGSRALEGYYNSDEYLKFCLADIGTEFRVPFFIIEGDNDWHVPWPLAREYFDTASAPDGEWFTLRRAGHMTEVDRPRELARLLNDEIFPRVFSTVSNADGSASK